MTGMASGKKWGDDGGGSLICPDAVAPICLMLSALAPQKSRRRFLLSPAHLCTGNPGKMAIKRLCVSAYVYIGIGLIFEIVFIFLVDRCG